MAVLRGGATALRIGKNVREMERLVADVVRQRARRDGQLRFVGALPRRRVAGPRTRGRDRRPRRSRSRPTSRRIVRAGLVPVFVDVECDTYQIDVDAIEAAIGPRTKAILAPNLIGNCPDWDRIRAIADAHGLAVIEDSCDCLGATLRGTPTGTRSDISVTSFALSHIITAAGTGGMVCLDDPALLDRALLLRRWGRRSEVKFFGSQRGDKRFFSDIDGLEYDDLFIFDEVGWNFEPSELSAAFGVVQMRKLPLNLARRKRNFALLDEHFGAPRRRVRAAPHHARRRHRLAHVPDHDPARVRRAPQRCSSSTWKRAASTPVWCGPATSRGSRRSPECRTASGRRTAQRRPRDGDGPDPPVQPLRSTTTASRTCARRSTRSSRRKPHDRWRHEHEQAPAIPPPVRLTSRGSRTSTSRLILRSSD